MMLGALFLPFLFVILFLFMLMQGLAIIGAFRRLIG